MQKSQRVQILQINNSYGNQYFIPYSVGLLQAYCQQFPEIQENYDFLEALYKRNPDLDLEIENLGQLDVVALSCYVWNWQYNLKFAEICKKKNPDALIVFGGPQVPDDPAGFHDKYPFVDILCHGEGEEVFYEILKCHMTDKDYSGIEGITYRDNKSKLTVHTSRRVRTIDINDIPSPYLSGVFDSLTESDIVWQASWETNRGCPYRCTFCAWGREYFNKIRKFSFEDRLKSEIKWFADKKIDLVFGCDANFGVFKRDIDIAQALIAAKEECGYPKKFRVCNAKNSNERVFQISQILNKGSMSKGTSLSVQSMDVETLSNIKRKNIGLDKFKDLMNKFNEAQMPTYTEVILGLPGESIETFKNGLETLLQSGQHSQIYIYNCTVLNNTEMADPSYITTPGIETKQIPVFQAHADYSEVEQIPELENIIIGSKTMPLEDWKKSREYSWAVQTFHMLGLIQNVAITLINRYQLTYSDLYGSLLNYGHKNPDTIIGQEVCLFQDGLERLLSGEEYGQELPSYKLNISWPPEEATYMRILENRDTFYSELLSFLEIYLDEKQITLESDLLTDLIEIQKKTAIHYEDGGQTINIKSRFNIGDYINNIRNGTQAILERSPAPKNYEIQKHWDTNGDKKKFARHAVWFGRKGGNFLDVLSETK